MEEVDPMKTCKRAAVLLALILLLAPALPALAEEVRYDANDGALYITFDQCVPGNQYALFILSPGADAANIDAGSVLFADQYKVSGGGDLILAFVQPPFRECEVVVGGVFADGAASPRLIGSAVLPADLGALELPAALTSIEAGAFEGGAFTHVYIGNKVKKIGSRAFANCAALVYVEIPASVTSIASDAFSGSAGVTIGCKSDSAAHRFAVARGIPFVLTD